MEEARRRKARRKTARRREGRRGRRKRTSRAAVGSGKGRHVRERAPDAPLAGRVCIEQTLPRAHRVARSVHAVHTVVHSACDNTTRSYGVCTLASRHACWPHGGRRRCTRSA
eukprot:3921000-Rhodomonas_salina.1